MSALPSPVKSPTITSTQVTAGLQVAHGVVEKANPLPVLIPTNHWPVARLRAATSVVPSPLKSPVSTFTQVAAGFKVPNIALLNPLVPFDTATHNPPPVVSCPRMPGMNGPVAVVVRKNRPV